MGFPLNAIYTGPGRRSNTRTVSMNSLLSWAKAV